MCHILHKCYSNSLKDWFGSDKLRCMKDNASSLCLREVDMLFRGFTHRKIELPTRLVMAPLPRLLSQNGVPTAEMLRYYLRRAQHMVGLIITEPVAVDDSASAADAGMARFYGGAALRAWKGVCRAVHSTPCRIAPQLCHVGMLRPAQGDMPFSASPAIGPSGIDPLTGEQRGESMSKTRIRSVVQAFASAAAAAKQIGFDAVEINGGQCCLIEQFLRAETNHRTDEYGGDQLGRTRFATEIIHAVRKAVGSHFPVIFRISQHAAAAARLSPLVSNPSELEQLLMPLRDAGVDIFACSGTSVDTPVFPGSALTLAGWVRRITGLPVITEGGVGSELRELDALLQRFRMNEFDLLAVGRALLADAEWGSKVHMADERFIRPYTRRAWGRLF